MMKFLQLRFLPASTDVALLVLRLWIGLTLLLNHGWGKASGYSQMAPKFVDPFGVGSHTTLALSVLAELICAALVVLGLFTRLAALIVIINLGSAFLFVHHRALSGPASGELAFVYLAGFFVLLIAGGGRFSFDSRIGPRV